MKDIDLWHGDCLEMMEKIPDDAVSMVFADLPYGVTAQKWDQKLDMQVLWRQFLRVGNPSCAFILTAVQPFVTDLICSARHIFKYDYIWCKRRASGFLSAQKAPLKNHEHVLIFGKNVQYNPVRSKPRKYSVTPGKGTYSRGNQGVNLAEPHRQAGLSYPKTVLCVDESELRTDTLNGNTNRRIHPTQKPVALLEYLIKTYAPQNGLVFDPTAGSMTTAVAAHLTGRRAICIEKSAEIFSKGVDRVKHAMTQPRQAVLP